MTDEKTKSLRGQTYVENNKLYSKLGDVFFTIDCRHLFICSVCDLDFEFLDVFIEHIAGDHDFQEVFQKSTSKRLVCISQIVDNAMNELESELIEEDTKELIEYRDDYIKNERTPNEGRMCSIQNLDKTNSTNISNSSQPVNSFKTEIKKSETVSEPELKGSDASQLVNTNELKEHKCDLCGKKFASENNLVRHKWRHSSQTKWSCPTCGKVTTTKDGMILHVRRKHTGEKPFKCKYCEKVFASTSQRNLHHRVHTGYKPYVCEKCGKSFKLHTVLRYHMNWHLGIKKYKCDKCDKTFHSTSELNNHKSVHTWERPFACTDCSLRFKTKRHLLRHKEVHSGKLKMCRYCNKGFAHISTLTSHLRQHQLDEM